MNILVVDDIAANRLALQAIFENEGHTVQEAADGLEALEVLEKGGIEAVISDILMPRMDGYRFCYEVRASERFHKLPFVFYTAGYTSPKDRKLALETGADKFLVKPASAKEILRALREAASSEHRRARDTDPSHELSVLKEHNQQLASKLAEKHTELTRLDEELFESEERLLLQSTALETAANAIAITDKKGIILWVNPAFVTLTGYAAEEVIGRTPRILKSGIHDREFYREFWETILSGKTWRGTFSNRRKNGEIYQDEHTITPVRSGGGGITHFIAIMTDVTERMEAEKKMRESEERLETIIQKMTEGLILADFEGKLLLWNPAALRMHGFEGDGKWHRRLTDFEDVFEFSTLDKIPLSREMWPLNRIFHGEAVRDLQLRLRRKSGDWERVFSYNGAVITDPNGSRMAFLTINDITERIQSEEQLRLLGISISNLNDIVLITEAEPLDEPGPRIVFVNEAFGQITGFSPSETLGRNPRFLQGEKTDQKILQEIREALARKQPVRKQIVNYRKDGGEYWIDVDIVPVFDSGGRCTHFAAIERDITEWKKAEAKIAEQAAFLDKARDAILVRDLEGNLVFWNLGAEHVYGWSRKEVIGRNIGELLYAQPEKFRELNHLAIQQGEWTGELQHRTKDGRTIIIEARWTLIRDDAGEAKSVLAINTDVTERKKIEAQFMRAQRMESIGTLAGGIAHDLNNILAPIMMSIDLLKMTSTNPKAQHFLETIEVSAKRGADIVRQVLSFARGLEGERIEVQPKHLLKDLENIIKETFPKDIRQQFFLPPDTWTILGDPTQIHQILLNLCVNARDAMPKGGDLTVSAENSELDEQYAAMNILARPGRYVKICVTDTGTGISPELLDKIFEPFFTTKELNKGTGLGLSTVMAIVKSHEGFVNVYSEPGNGTTFKVYLPKADGSPEIHRELLEQRSVPRGNGETILLVDDEASILTITSQTLQAFGYRVLSARDGAEAVAIYAQHRDKIGAVLTDMRMPVMDGPAMIHALMRINPQVKIIGASGLTGNDGTARAAGAGVKHFLTKPYTAATLLMTLRTVLGGS